MSAVTLTDQAVMLLIYDAELERNYARLGRIERQLEALQVERRIVVECQHALHKMIKVIKEHRE
jgi:hypothetical protein